jgi:hypothetical protein
MHRRVHRWTGPPVLTMQGGLEGLAGAWDSAVAVLATHAPEGPHASPTCRLASRYDPGTSGFPPHLCVDSTSMFSSK